MHVLECSEWGTDSVGPVLMFRSRWGAEDRLELGNQRFHSAQELPHRACGLTVPTNCSVIIKSSFVQARHVVSLIQDACPYCMPYLQAGIIRSTVRPCGSSICYTRIPDMSLTSTQCQRTIMRGFWSRNGVSNVTPHKDGIRDPNPQREGSPINTTIINPNKYAIPSSSSLCQSLLIQRLI